ncbi:MAG: CoA-binding protein [Sphingobacteriaceae bacterium]|nr:CoA-binding protein [Sphingobacteriaceae bacterium]
MNTLIIGASEEPSRYSNMAANRLLDHGHTITLLGKRPGEVRGHTIYTALPADLPRIDTVTVYVNPQHLETFRDTILSLAPRRVIFNPGTEHPEFMNQLRENGIEALAACTLVMLSIGAY